MGNKKTWFTSDYHFGHKNVIKYDRRPFKTVEEMNQTLIHNQNELVQDQDDFYFLGDFAMSLSEDSMRYLMQRLRGNLFFIRGNHDKNRTIKLYEQYGTYLGEQCKINIEGQDIVLNHYSMNVWDRSHHGAYHLFGHSHGSLKADNSKLSFDVGCMLFDYKPIEFEEVQKIMSKKVWKAIDHHGK